MVKVKLQSGKSYPYYPQALKPVLTREKVGQIDAPFSLQIDSYVKRDMQIRLQLDIDFIKDIGSLSGLSDLEFNTETCTVEEIGYTKGMVPLPKLICGKDKALACGKEIQVIFSYEDRFGEIPKNVVIHRDGFSNENDDWYKNYFGA